MGVVITVYDHLLLHTHISDGPSSAYVFLESLGRNVGAGFIGAVIGGSILVYYVNVKFQEKPYGYSIAIVSVVFIFIVASVAVIMGFIIVPRRSGASMGDPDFWPHFYAFISDAYPLKSALVWFFIVEATQVLLQVSSKFGPGVFWDIIRGKYNVPRKETKIFMFMDLNSSTAMAEKLGNETYHSLLKDFFSDITEPIISNKGIIYQYVGDEVIISWSLDEGLPNARCIRCFFDIKQRIENVRGKYLTKYGLVPTFKAGIHCGNVVAGEVGIIKRDITFSGDVLNTTSRMLGKCKELKTEFISSSLLIQKFKEQVPFRHFPLGSIKLHGKQQEMHLSAIEWQ